MDEILRSMRMPDLRLVLSRSLDALKPRPARRPTATALSRWDQPLTGDNWIGVFLIVVSLLSYLVGFLRTTA
jgi:hypothetical protein